MLCVVVYVRCNSSSLPGTYTRRRSAFLNFSHARICFKERNTKIVHQWQLLRFQVKNIKSSPYHLIYGRHINEKCYKYDARNEITSDQIRKDFSSKITHEKSYFTKRFEDEYITAIQEREYYNHQNFKDSEQLVIQDVGLVKEDNLPRMLWRKGPIINVIRGVDKLIGGAETKVRQHNSDKMLTLKRPFKYLVQFEIMDADKRFAENNDFIVDIHSVEMPPPIQIRRTAAIKADLLQKLNDIDGDIDEWAWWLNVTKEECIVTLI